MGKRLLEYMNDRWQGENEDYSEQARITEQTRFRRILARVNPAAIEQLDYRRERQVYLLTNETRTIGQIARLLALPPVEVAHLMKRLLEQGYVEAVSNVSNEV